MRIRYAACVFPPLLFEVLFRSLEHALLLVLSGLLPRLPPVPTRPGPPRPPLGSARAGGWGSPDGHGTSPRARMTLGMRPRSSDHASFARSALSTRCRGEGVLVSDVPVLVRSADRPKAAE